MAIKAVAIIGNPAGTKGVSTKAVITEEQATARAVLVVKRGQISPKKAAGTAASKPQADGSPIDLVPSAPAKVNKFQKIKTPIPVSQKPWRIAGGPSFS